MYDRIELVVGPNKRFTAQIHVLNNVFVYTVFVVNNCYVSNNCNANHDNVRQRRTFAQSDLRVYEIC